MKPYMSTDEIRMRYKQANNQREIIGILAQLNDCTIWAIRRILFQQEDERMKLYCAGLTDGEIARRVKKTTQAIWIWRRRRGLPANADPGFWIGTNALNIKSKAV